MGRSKHVEMPAPVPPGVRGHQDAAPELDTAAREPDVPNVRPVAFDSYIGQAGVVDNVSISVRASRHRGDSLDHFLFTGPPGLGKTTLASVIAAEMGVDIKITSGPAIEHKGAMASILTSMGARDILFVDEIHRLRPEIEEMLYPAMEDRKLDMIIGDGPHAKVIRMDLEAFTLLGATTRPDLVGQPLRDRFGHVFTMDYYSGAELTEIVVGSARRTHVELPPSAAHIIAGRARGTPRIANRLLRRVRDFADADEVQITEQVANQALTKLGIDEAGLDRLDRRYLETLRARGREPTGIEALAAAMGESRDTLVGMVEPFLVMVGFVSRTARGRVITSSGLAHLITTVVNA